MLQPETRRRVCDIMTRYVNIRDAKQNLADLVLAAEGGAEFIITEEGRPAARLAPVEQRMAREPAGIRRETMPAEFKPRDVRVAEMMDEGEVPRAMRRLPGR